MAGFDLPVREFGHGRPIVLLHGFPMDRSIWDQQVERWRRATA